MAHYLKKHYICGEIWRIVFKQMEQTSHSDTTNILREDNRPIDSLNISDLVKIAKYHAFLTNSSCILMSFPDGKILYHSDKLLFLNQATDKDRQRDCENPYWVYVKDAILDKLIKLRTEFLHYCHKMDLQEGEIFYSTTEFPITLKGKDFFITQQFVPMMIDSEKRIRIGMLTYNTSPKNEMESYIVSKTRGFLKFNFKQGRYEDIKLTFKLSKTEMVILGLMKKGLDNKGIGGNLNVSIFTVKAHKRSIFKKLGVSSTAEALVYADKYHLLSDGGCKNKIVTKQQQAKR